MTRLVDRLLLAGKTHIMNIPDTTLETAEVIVADNVAHYFYEEERYRKGDLFTIRSFPNVAPVFTNFFVEYRIPRRFHGLAEEVGIHFHAVELTDSVREHSLTKEFYQFASENTKWVYFCTLHFMRGNELFQIRQLLCFSVGDDGAPLTMLDGKHEYLLCVNKDTELDRESGEAELVEKYVTVCLYPSLLALSFLHCKNVTMKTESPAIALSKKYEKKHGKSLEKYHILNIEPMKKIIRKEGGSAQTGLRQALHICRGHFKDFTKGKGLFGRNKGLYWWDSQARGSMSAGVVDKDYAVKIQ